MDSLNIPIGSIQSILGHENRKTTEIYIHNNSSTKEEAMNLYESARIIINTSIK